MNLRIKIGDIEFKNPIWLASGTCGHGRELKEFIDLDRLGAIVTKTITLHARAGNKSPRIIETPSGLLNSIGIENNGAEYFKNNAYPFLKNLKTNIVVSVTGNSEKEFLQCIEILEEENFPHAFEINLSCPNIEHGIGKVKLCAQDGIISQNIISAVKKITRKIIIAKLTPNVTDIAAIAKACADGGANAVSMVNTYYGMAINACSMKPVLGNIIGGVSGPAIKPMALKAVWDAYKVIQIPIIGVGGIQNGIDAAEFMLAGASCVQIGTANFINPTASINALVQFEDYLQKKSFTKAYELIGRAHI